MASPRALVALGALLVVLTGCTAEGGNAGAAASSMEDVDWPVRATYTIGDGSEEPLKHHEFSGTGWDEWRERSFDPSFEICQTLIPGSGLLSTMEECESPYVGGGGPRVVYPNGYFRDFRPGIDPAETDAPAIAAVADRLGLGQDSLAANTSQTLIPCPATILDCPDGSAEQVPQVETTVGHPGLDMVLSIQTRVRDVLVYELRVTSLEHIDAYAPDLAAVEAARAGTTLDDLLRRWRSGTT